MVRYVKDKPLFFSQADAFVNPVNCKGVMGKGIAVEFRKRFPECFPVYKEACSRGKLLPGKLLFIQLIVQPDIFVLKRPAIILFPTKNHWRDKSCIEWIDQGLIYLKKHYREWNLKSIAMPQIGCGLGGLDWKQVKSLLEKHLNNETIEVEVYLDNSLIRYSL